MDADINQLEKRINNFILARKWNTSKLSSTYNMLCNLTEEIGEVWNVVKWIGEEKDMHTVIDKNRDELKDGIGDLLWCTQRLASIFGVNMYESLEERLYEYEKRFPIDKVIGKKSNPTLGGYDGKYVN